MRIISIGGSFNAQIQKPAITLFPLVFMLCYNIKNGNKKMIFSRKFCSHVRLPDDRLPVCESTEVKNIRYSPAEDLQA